MWREGTVSNPTAALRIVPMAQLAQHTQQPLRHTRLHHRPQLRPRPQSDSCVGFQLGALDCAMALVHDAWGCAVPGSGLPPRPARSARIAEAQAQAESRPDTAPGVTPETAAMAYAVMAGSQDPAVRHAAFCLVQASSCAERIARGRQLGVHTPDGGEGVVAISTAMRLHPTLTSSNLMLVNKNPANCPTRRAWPGSPPRCTVPTWPVSNRPWGGPLPWQPVVRGSWPSAGSVCKGPSTSRLWGRSGSGWPQRVRVVRRLGRAASAAPPQPPTLPRPRRRRGLCQLPKSVRGRRAGRLRQGRGTLRLQLRGAR